MTLLARIARFSMADRLLWTYPMTSRRQAGGTATTRLQSARKESKKADLVKSILTADRIFQKQENPKRTSRLGQGAIAENSIQ
jgi:hypothetical protein